MLKTTIFHSILSRDMTTADTVNLLQELRDVLEKAENLETQLEVHRLHDVVDRAQYAGLPQDFAHAVRAALAVAKSKSPNLNIVREIRNRLDLDILNQRSGLVPRIRRQIGASPVYAMLVGTLFAFIAGIAILSLAIISWNALKPYGVVGDLRVKEIVLVVFAAIVGACVSILSRSDTFASLFVYDPFLIFVNCLVKPIVACGLAVTVYCIFGSGIMQVAGLTDAIAGKPDEAGPDLKLAAILWVVGFVVGFSERLAADLISRTESVFGTSQQVR
jgi:hypothetical protein